MARLLAGLSLAGLAAAQSLPPGFEKIDCALGCNGEPYEAAEVAKIAKCVAVGQDAYCVCKTSGGSGAYTVIPDDDCDPTPPPSPVDPLFNFAFCESMTPDCPDKTKSTWKMNGVYLCGQCPQFTVNSDGVKACGGQFVTTCAAANIGHSLGEDLEILANADERAGVEVALDVALQAFVVAITVGMFIFFSFESYKGHASWEILFVSFVEAFLYVLAAALPARYMPTFGPYSTPMLRYLSWMTTCPFLIKVMLNSVDSSMDMGKSNKLIAADILMNAMGILSVIYPREKMVPKMFLFCIGCLIAIYIVHCVWYEWNANYRKLDQQGMRKVLMGLMLFSWTMFPVFFLIGPETFGLCSNATSILLHAIGDLLAKNLFSFIAWKIERNSRLAREEAEKEGNFNEELVELSRKSMAIAMDMVSERESSMNHNDRDFEMTKDTIRDQEEEIAMLRRQLGQA